MLVRRSRLTPILLLRYAPCEPLVCRCAVVVSRCLPPQSPVLLTPPIYLPLPQIFRRLRHRFARLPLLVFRRSKCSHHRSCNMSNCVLTRANLESAILHGTCTILSHSQMELANLTACKFKATRLDDTMLKRVILRQVDLSGLDLVRACLTLADLSDGQYCGTNFTEANLTGATLLITNFEKQISSLQVCKVPSEPSSSPS